MKKLTLKKAKELSIKKWKIIVKQNGSDEGINTHPDFQDLDIIAVFVNDISLIYLKIHAKNVH